jgi:hypothetical protein
MKVAGSLVTAQAAKEAGMAIQAYWQGTVAPGQSVYSVAMSFDQTSWADWWSKPDVYLVVECEGVQTVLIPEIDYNWDGSRKVYTFRCPTLPAGARGALKLFDDDSASNAIWKNILATPVQWSVTGTNHASLGLPGSGVDCLDVTMAASGVLQVLDSEQKKTFQLDPPDLVAVAEFTVPSPTVTGPWTMAGKFSNGGNPLGKVELKHWNTNALSSRWQFFTRPWFLFWAILALGLGIGWKLIARQFGMGRHLDRPVAILEDR